MNVSYEGIGYLAVTVPAGNCKVGDLCRVNSAGMAERCSDGQAFCGMVEAVRLQMATVQLEGFVKVRYTGTMPTRGYTKLSANAAGGVKVDSAGKEYLIMDVNGSEATAVIKL